MIQVKTTARNRGIAMLEVTAALAALLILALLLLKASLNVVVAQGWTVKQSLSDSFLTHEVALATRIPFTELRGVASQWPTFPASKNEVVEIGRLPGGKVVSAKLYRTKIAASGNLAYRGGQEDLVSNPTAMETWILKSLLTFDISGRPYVKTRTMVRTR